MIHRPLLHRLGAALLPLALTSGAATAHPHVFVEAGVELLVEDGALAGVRLVWLYDDFFSFMLASDLGVDLDGDLVLTPEDEAALAAGVLDWPEEYEGDLSILAGGETVALGNRDQTSVGYPDGRIEERHRRMLATPQLVGAEGVIVQVFDPYYYVAYEITDVSVQGGADCEARLVKADIDAGQAAVEAEIGRVPADFDQSEEMPPMGHLFADSVVLTCGP